MNCVPGGAHLPTKAGEILVLVRLDRRGDYEHTVRMGYIAAQPGDRLYLWL